MVEMGIATAVGTEEEREGLTRRYWDKKEAEVERFGGSAYREKVEVSFLTLIRNFWRWEAT